MKTGSMFFVLALFSIAAYSQRYVGVAELTVKSGWVIKPGDLVEVGIGSLSNKDFAFIHASSMSIAGRMPLPAHLTGSKLKVKQIEQVRTKRDTTIQLVVGVGSILDYYIELAAAIKTGEIIDPMAKAPTTVTPVASVADELKKLKDLLDSGALTQDEYNAAKKKLLSQ